MSDSGAITLALLLDHMRGMEANLLQKIDGVGKRVDRVEKRIDVAEKRLTNRIDRLESNLLRQIDAIDERLDAVEIEDLPKRVHLAAAS